MRYEFLVHSSTHANNFRSSTPGISRESFKTTTASGVYRFTMQWDEGIDDKIGKLLNTVDRLLKGHGKYEILAFREVNSSSWYSPIPLSPIQESVSHRVSHNIEDMMQSLSSSEVIDVMWNQNDPVTRLHLQRQHARSINDYQSFFV